MNKAKAMIRPIYLSIVFYGFVGVLTHEVSAMSGNALSPCPQTPNCVSSESKDSRAMAEPFRYQGSGEEALQRLKEVVLARPRTRLVEEKSGYLHFEFRSRWLGFVDDVEFQRRDSDKVIAVRSASRTGYWDLGVNGAGWRNFETRLTNQHQAPRLDDLPIFHRHCPGTVKITPTLFAIETRGQAKV